MISINRAENRFELETNGKLSFMNYTPKDDRTLALTHTEVHPSLEGRGIGKQLVEGVFAYLDEHKLKMLPLCSFVAKYLKSHPEYNHLVSPLYRKEG